MALNSTKIGTVGRMEDRIAPRSARSDPGPRSDLDSLTETEVEQDAVRRRWRIAAAILRPAD